MTSSMLAGERRWASTRRSSMTVLGKVAVPKPLNLPSQRLENHGLDPNVEIVPKGSLSWGSHSSSSASNPWGSSGLSPHGDGANGSPSHVSGRPSSGGSGTRPSTAGSDRMHEPTPSAWGPNSRPSSASGALTSNQTSSTPLRPHSAETRPGSSQLSRFAEPLPDNSVAWGSGTVDKLIISSTKNDGFSLSSGDFPTLGSERENSGKNTESEDYGSHGRPSSSSGRLASPNDRTVTSEADVKGGTINTCKRDGTQHVENGVKPSSENWQGGDPQQYLNANVPQHFDAWHGPPINAPAGVWFRGPPGGPPYGPPPVAPGGFPIEPFPYYRPQMPPPALGNPQQVPQPLNGPRGHHPKNGDLYRAQIPDAYMHPGMPIRPGFYPCQVPYENYYGPPIAYCNPNERDIPFMGMATGPPVFNRYPAQNTPEPSNSHARAGGRGSSDTTLVSEQVESGHSDNTRGPYKVLIKQHNEWDTKEGSWEHTAPGNVPFLEKGSQTTFRKNERGSDNRRDEETHSKRTPLDENSASINCDNRGGHSLNSVGVKSPERVDKAKAVDDSWGKKSETGDSSVSQVLPAALKDSTLLQKIKGLNDKARASDGRQDVAFAFSREDQKNRLQFDIPKANNSLNEIGTAVVCSERPHSGDLIAASNEAGVSKEHMNHQSTAFTAISRREGRVDHRGKGRFNDPNADGWRKKPLVAECSTEILRTNVGSVSSTVHGQDHHTSVEAAERSETNLPVRDEGEFLAPMFDPSDCQAQMRELARQRAIELRKEEEERIREQKAKALAKLEELNRRTQARDGPTQKLETAPPSGDILQDQEVLQTLTETVMDAGRNEAPSLVLVSCRKEVAQTSDNSNSGVEESSVLSRNSHLETSKNAKQDTLVPQFLPSKLDVHHAGAADVTTAPQVNGGSVSRHKSSGYTQKQNIHVEKHFTESLIPFGTIGEPDIYSCVALKDIISAETVPGEVVPSCESNLSDNSNIIPESSAHQRKKIIKTGKNKSKLEDPLPVTALPSQVSREPNRAKASTESGKAKSSRSELDPGSVQSVAKAVAHFSDQPSSSLPGEESRVKINNQWKAQQSRRMPRNGLANKVADKFHGNDAAVWAPVRSNQKAESVDEASQKTVPDAVIVTAKGDNLVQNSIKSKRAEMERYVPKPVAKELAQQGSIQQSVSSSFSQTTSDEMVSREDSTFQRTESSLLARSVVENLGRTVESNSGDNKQNKQAKSHGAWRQRGSVESSRVQMGSSLTSNPNKNVQKYMDQHESLKPEVNQVKVELNISDGWDTSDGWNMPEDPNAAAAVTFGMKDQGGVKGKGKRHPYKGHKSTGNKHDLDQKNNNSGEMNKNHVQSASLEISQEDRSVTAKESGNGERASSHWQPKSQAYSANTQTGSRSSGGQHVSAETDRAIKKDSHPMDGDSPSTQDKEHSEVVLELHSDQSVSKNKCVGEAASNTRRQEGRRERKVASSKERPQHPNFGLVSTDEQAPPESGDAHLEQRISLGFHKHGNQNNRSGRGHESRGDWSSVAQDNRHFNVPGNREIQSQNAHYEYQPVGSHNFNKGNNVEGLTDGSRNMGSRYRERGRGHSRRGGGNSYG